MVYCTKITDSQAPLKVTEGMLRFMRWLWCASIRNTRWFSGLVGLLCFLGTVASLQVAYAQQPSPEFDLSQVTPPTSPPMALVGQAIYQENCAPCHGVDGKGDGPTAPDLTSPATAFADPNAIWERSPAELFHTTKFGRIEKLMPPWLNQLDDSQIWQAVAYAWSLHTTQANIEAGAELYAQSCASCHGEKGAGDGPEATPDLVNFTDLTNSMARSQADWQAGWQAAHPELGADWTPDQQRNVLEYMRAFTYKAPWANAYEAGTGVITGTVAQGTPGGAAVTGLTVTLEAYVSFTPVAVFTTTVDSSGVFAFSELDTAPEIVYLVAVASEGIRYTSPVLNFTPEQPRLQTQVAIYATTNDPAAVQVDRLHWIIDSRPGVVVVGEIFSFSNTGDRTFIGQTVEGIDAPVTVALRVPTEAQELTFDNGEIGVRFQQVDDTVYDTTPVTPGEGTRQIIMRYFLPVDGSSLDFEREFLYPVNQMTILVAELPQLEVTIPGFTLASRETLQNQTYQLWQPEGTAPTNVAIQLAGLLQEGDADPRTVGSADPQPNAPTGAAAIPLLQPWMPWVVGSVAGVALLGVLLWSLQQQRTGKRAPLQELRAQREVLLQQIAHLDDRHAIGEIDDTAWQRERAHLKAQLLQIADRVNRQPATQP